MWSVPGREGKRISLSESFTRARRHLIHEGSVSREYCSSRNWVLPMQCSTQQLHLLLTCRPSLALLLQQILSRETGGVVGFQESEIISATGATEAIDAARTHPVLALSAVLDAVEADAVPAWSLRPCSSSSSTLEAAIAAAAHGPRALYQTGGRSDSSREPLERCSAQDAAAVKECVTDPRLAGQPDPP